jgi:N-acetylglucosamine-6-sulfatase
MIRDLFKVLALTLCLGLFLSATAQADGRKNIVLIQTDDQSIKTLRANYIGQSGQAQPVMPILRNEILANGVEFTNHYASSPVCAPNRTALLSGRYPHTTNVVANNGPYGGWQGWANSTALNNNFVSRLDQVGYRTAHFGKWTNYYGDPGGGPDIIPPGWDTWLSDYYDDSTRDYYGYYQRAKIDHLGLNGVVGPIGSESYQYLEGIDNPETCRPGASLLDECFYHTDRMTTYAGLEILDAASKRDPFYIQIDYHAPHGDKVIPTGPQPASRHLDSARNTNILKGSTNPNYNENTDVNPTKPFLIRKNNGPITIRNEVSNLRHSWRRGLESLRSVDEGISYLIDALKEAGEYNNTYIIFTSDNGFFYGDHRFVSGKLLAYEEAAKIPFIVSGPGLSRSKTNAPTSTIDVGPTILDLTNTSRGNYQTDGKSLADNTLEPVMYPENIQDGPYAQRAQLIELIDSAEVDGSANFQFVKPFFLNPNRSANGSPVLRYRAIKIGRYKYIKYNNTGPELYDLYLDREELRNQIRNPAYQNILKYMKDNFQYYKNCQGEACLVSPSPVPSRL